MMNRNIKQHESIYRNRHNPEQTTALKIFVVITLCRQADRQTNDPIPVLPYPGVATLGVAYEKSATDAAGDMAESSFSSTFFTFLRSGSLSASAGGEDELRTAPHPAKRNCSSELGIRFGSSKFPIHWFQSQ
jgi:hypothetical protein